VNPLSYSSRRITGGAVLLGLLGAALAALALVDVSPGHSAAHRAESPAGSGGLSPAGPAASSPAGLRLLREAAAAGVRTSYQGVQIVAWWGPHGASTSVVQVWHERDRSILAQVTDMGAVPSAAAPSAATPVSVGEQDPDGILGLSRQLLVLMSANYEVIYAGRGSVDNRQAQIVDLRRRDGSLAARFWLDNATKLPLRRETFDSRARMISEDAFINLRIGDGGLRGMPVADVRAWSSRLDAAQIARLRMQGWPVPAQLPGNLKLVAAHRTVTAAGPVMDLDYSDGLSLVSVFLQRGQLPRALPGWQETTLRGRAVYSTDPDWRSLAWSARGFVYTVIAEAPAATIDQVVDALPHDAGPGFWGRIARGMRRLASWANPFR
jgi:sigma-E factor negative regulatory protein RseB